MVKEQSFLRHHDKEKKLAKEKYNSNEQKYTLNIDYAGAGQ